MKERVELNNNGRSIESHCKSFHNKKWESRYIVCKLQTDLEDPLLNLYKCRKDRQKDKVKQSIILRNYIGFEKSFPLKNRNQTLTIITKDTNVVLSFQLPETLLQWETWFKNIGGQSTTIYMQLLRFPNQLENPAFLNKEVRCHLHDSRLAIVHNIPAETLLYCEVAAANIISDVPNHLVHIQPYLVNHEEFVLNCPSIDKFSKFLEKANGDGDSLNQYLNKKTSEGVWIQTVPRKQRNQDSISRLSDTSGFLNLLHQQSTSANPSEIFASRTGLNNIGSQKFSFNKTPLGSRKFRNNSIFEQQPNESNYVNTFNQLSSDSSDAKQRSTSLPEYVNIHTMVRPPSKNSYHASVPSNSVVHEIIHRKASTLTAPRDSPRFSNSDERQYPQLLGTPKGRSMMDFTTIPYEDAENKMESWKRAKKFISAFSPKSQLELHRNGRFSNRKIKKSSSTSALSYNVTEATANLATTSSMSELDELPPALNVSVSNPSPVISNKEHKVHEEAPTGLVRLREEGTLKARGGVNQILARRLAAGINGSFSKYDGERATHLYPQGSYRMKNSDGVTFIRKTNTLDQALLESESSDPIENAIQRERMKMRQNERRASSVSFQKANHVQMNHLQEMHKKAFQKAPLLPSKSAQPYYETNIMSSSESLSSDARSKISIKKRSNSPPHDNAPVILKKQASQRTLTLQKQSSSSIDSLNSQKTARTSSPIKLPTRIIVNNSSSSEESSGKSQIQLFNDHSVIQIPDLTAAHRYEPSSQSHQSLSRSSSRRMSEGQGSSSAETVGQMRKGYFRKNNKIRRSHRHLNEPSPEMC